MKFSCESCSAQYMISDDKVGPAGVKVRCKKCGNIMAVKRPPAAAPAPLEPAPTLAAAPSGPAASAGGAPGETSLENELGTAFQNVFGGGSAAIAAEKATAHPAAPPAEASNPAHNGVAGAEAIHDWYVAIDDAQVGPLAAAAVKTRWESAEIGPDTLAWRPGMADWVSLSRIPEMAQYLAPVARGAAKAAPAPTPAPHRDAPAAAAPAATPVPGVKEPAKSLHANGANGANGKPAEWKPTGASALAALASEEMASLAKPEVKAAPEPVATRGSGSLLDRMDLPDGGVDPTNVLPLPIKGLEQTNEAPIKQAPAPRSGESTDIRQLKKSTRRSLIAIGGGMLLLFAVGLAVVVSVMRPSREAPAPVAAAPVAAAPAPAPVAAAPEPVPSPAAAAPATPNATPTATPTPNANATPTPAPAGTASAAAAPNAPPPAAAVPPPAPKEPERVAAAPAQREPPPQREVVSKRTRHREPPP
ncbi:MAG: GYF domain-containing protein, partial [Anaeromyxobacteraceae bacterium]